MLESTTFNVGSFAQKLRDLGLYLFFPQKNKYKYFLASHFEL